MHKTTTLVPDQARARGGHVDTWRHPPAARAATGRCPPGLESLHRASPDIWHVLATSPTVDAARDRLYTLLNHRERELHTDKIQLHPIDQATALRCIAVFKNMLAPRNESAAGLSTLQSLWHLVHRGSESIHVGFVQEFVHLFRGIEGRSGRAAGWLGPILAQQGEGTRDDQALHGRAAGQARSRLLDRFAKRMWEKARRYPNGLDPDLIAQRKRNKARLLEFFGASPDDWQRYAWHLRHILTGDRAVEQLPQLVALTDVEKEAIRLCAETGIPFGITPYYLSLFDIDSAGRRKDAQVRAQVIPPMHYVERLMEHHEDREHYFDFMGEHDTSPIDLVTRRYPAVAILKGYDTCPQICVYCQRNWEITGPMEAGALPPLDKLDAALDWFAEHQELREVLITGGDPLFLSDSRLEYMLDRLAAMEHVVNIRIGSRAPVTLPMRITDKLAALLGRYVEPGRRNLSVVTHAESAAEVTPEMAEAVYRLRRQGLCIYNQQVFTLHTSRRFQAVALRVALKKIGVDPYYTFYPKGKEETKEYATPLARLLQERKEEARLLPGSFRTDEPVFNVPRLGKNHVRASQDRELIAIRPDGRRVYLWHPWEKGIAPTKPWLYLDSSIHQYLRALEQLGEDPADYAGIWYYY
ncbi:MAG: KamA family radical SAM protein [Anaerolineae bacterium]|nr:KamA family radical SAM protein [Anaerolineae bacterium]